MGPQARRSQPGARSVPASARGRLGRGGRQQHVFYAKITQIRGPEELKQPKMVYFGGSWSLLFNIKTQELNVSLLLLKS